MTRSDKDEKSRQYGRYTLWKGCHIDCDKVPSIEDMKVRLVERFRDDLHVAQPIQPAFAGLAWKQEDIPIGIMFRVPFEDAVADSMSKKEFRKRGRFETITGTWMSGSDALNCDVEPWSKSFVNKMGVL